MSRSLVYDPHELGHLLVTRDRLSHPHRALNHQINCLVLWELALDAVQASCQFREVRSVHSASLCLLAQGNDHIAFR